MKHCLYKTKQNFYNYEKQKNRTNEQHQEGAPKNSEAKGEFPPEYLGDNQAYDRKFKTEQH